ncbi:MAG: ferritin-like domain-containing protein [Oscillospiraceae bacterium]|nr:ferritin-like domain-containing protein [Oscillospiraceae bacterium]
MMTTMQSTQTINNLKNYIAAEIHDSMLYSELAKIAPTIDDRTLLMEFAADEQSHADEFKRILRSITGQYFNPIPERIIINMPYRDILRDRVIDESGDFRKYGLQYIETPQNSPLKTAYYRARTDENVHALRLLKMLSTE